MKMYLVTHGNRNFGCDPSLTDKGFEQIADIRVNLLPKIPAPPLVVIGVGRRFEETYQGLNQSLRDIPMKWSPFSGSGDALEIDGRIALPGNISVTNDDYIGMVNNPGFDAWRFISSLPEDTLLCSGEELMMALGFESDKGRLYEIDTERRTCRQVV